MIFIGFFLKKRGTNLKRLFGLEGQKQDRPARACSNEKNKKQFEEEIT